MNEAVAARVAMFQRERITPRDEMGTASGEDTDRRLFLSESRLPLSSSSSLPTVGGGSSSQNLSARSATGNAGDGANGNGNGNGHGNGGGSGNRRSNGGSGVEAGGVGWVVEFLFPPHITAFGNLQKKSMRANPIQPMRQLIEALVDKCAATPLTANERLQLSRRLELQSITGVVFRDNDTVR